MTEQDVPDDAVPLMLHERRRLRPERMPRLIEAVDTVHEAIEAEVMIDRRMVGALWILGIEANSALGGNWLPEEEANINALLEAIEETLIGFWPVGHLKDKDGVKNGVSIA